MAMTARKKMVRECIPRNELLPPLLASLGFRGRPDLANEKDREKHRIHWAIHILRYGGFKPPIGLDFECYHGGPFSHSLEDALEAINWDDVTAAGSVEDDMVAAVREAIDKGDDFLLALSIAVGVADQNHCTSKKDVSEMVSYIDPELIGVADAACDFAEARIWSK